MSTWLEIPLFSVLPDIPSHLLAELAEELAEIMENVGRELSFRARPRSESPPSAHLNSTRAIQPINPDQGCFCPHSVRRVHPKWDCPYKDSPREDREDREDSDREDSDDGNCDQEGTYQSEEFDPDWQFATGHY